MTVEVRSCTTTDLVALRERWPLPDDVHGSHAAESGTYLVAWEGDEPLGSGVVRWAGSVGDRAREAHPDAPALIHLHVREQHRGRGVGTDLVRAAERVVLAGGARVLALGVGIDNPGAARLYERLDFVRTGVQDTVEYTWLDSDGVRHLEVETSELLVKDVTNARHTGVSWDAR